MTLACKCLEKRVESARIEETLDENEITLLSASKFLRRVGLKINDVKMKLGVNKIIHYLQRICEEGQEKYSFINHVEKEDSKFCHLTDFEREDGNKENLREGDEPESFRKVETSKSFLSEQNTKEEFIHKSVPFGGITLSKAFKLKQVVTKNSLQQQPEKLCIPHKRYNSVVNSAAESQNNYQIIERLQLQNQNLEKCLKNMFSFFEERKLISLNDSAQDLQSYQYSNMVEKLTCNFIDYEQDINQQIANLSAKSSLLQQTIHNMSISLRIQKDGHQEQPQNASKSTQTELEAAEQLDELEKELNEAQQSLREKQILLFIKDQEIFSLKVMVSDLEKRAKVLPTADQKSRSQSIKNFFEITGQNLNNSTR